MEDVELNLEINQEENEVSPEESVKTKKCGRCRRRSFRMKNEELCSSCEDQEETTAMTTPEQNDVKTER